MIGSFLFSSRPRSDDVVVWLQSGPKGVGARLTLPDDIQRLMIIRDYPPPAPSMSIESALSYAIFLAIRSGLSMVIAGDKRLWNADWGYLTDISQFPTAGLAPQSAHRPRD